MMSKNRLSDYIEHIQQAAGDAYSFTENMTHQEFLKDKKTQQAVILNLIIIGEAATKSWITTKTILVRLLRSRGAACEI